MDILTETTTITAITTIDGGAVSGAALLRLLSWLSPAFPLGGFSYSGGLERAAHDRLLKDADDVEEWLAVSLRHGFLWNDAVLLCEAHRAAGDPERLAATAALAAALAGSRERHAETRARGAAVVAAAGAWSTSDDEALPPEMPLPVAFGAIAASHGIGLEVACQGYLHAQVSQYISAAIRLSLAGQVAGLAVLSGLEEPILEQAARAAASTPDDLGGCAFSADIAALRHETQHSRLFRS